MITPAYEPACGGSASVHNYGVTHPDPARFAELDDAKIFYAYGHAYELARRDAERGICTSLV